MLKDISILYNLPSVLVKLSDILPSALVKLSDNLPSDIVKISDISLFQKGD